MNDWESSPASFLSHHRVAELFYEMHSLCENELSLSQRQKHLVELGYLLYSSTDAPLLITSLSGLKPELILEVHKVMLRVCHEALYYMAHTGYPTRAKGLMEYDSAMRLIREKNRYLKANFY